MRACAQRQCRHRLTATAGRADISCPERGYQLVDYLGVLDDAHHLAVVRTALRAHGFDLPTGAMADLVVEHRVLGRRFVDNILPRWWPPFLSEETLERIRCADSSLWARLPVSAAFGWRQARVLQLFAGTPENRGVDTTYALSATFNATISLIDYIIDELPIGAALFDTLDLRLVATVLDPNAEVDRVLEQARAGFRGPNMELLFALVWAFASIGRHLLVTEGNHESWRALSTLVMRMFQAERRSVLETCGQRHVDDAGRLEAMEQKSILPSVATLYIAHLAGPHLPSASAVHAATALGQILWRIDDLVDLLTDCRRGVRSAMVTRLEELVHGQGRQIVADADLYQVVDRSAGDIVSMLEPRAFGDAATPDTLRALIEYAHVCVGGWADWQDNAPSRGKRRCAGTDTSDPASRALEVLLGEQRKGYADAAHHLRLPRADHRHERHAALLMLRAVVLDAMLDAQDSGIPVPEPVLCAEAMAILQSKHRVVRGGWSYIANVPELPPDVDDNGQVMQALWRVGGRALVSTCEEPVRLSLDTAGQDGEIQTWVLDPRGDTHADAVVRRYLSVIGGSGVHPEVVANLGYGLLLVDQARFAQPLQNIAAYLERVQNEDGSWTSRWYDGPYYGTWKAVAVLRHARPDSRALTRARSFVLSQQHPDGAWGRSVSRPLSTALALLTMHDLGMAPHSPVVARGVTHLLSAQHPSGHWAACPWIRFPTLDGTVGYGSEALTTAFCMKAILASSRHHDRRR